MSFSKDFERVTCISPCGEKLKLKIEVFSFLNISQTKSQYNYTFCTREMSFHILIMGGGEVADDWSVKWVSTIGVC